MRPARAPGWYAVDPWESARDRQMGIPGANAPGMGGGRLKLPRPSATFFGRFRGFELFPFRR
jgi:hypothetical protein